MPKIFHMNPLHYYLIFFGLVFLAIFVWMMKRRLNVLLSGGRAQGYVVGHEKRHSDDSTSYHPVFSFVDHQGVQHQITSDTGWSAPRPQIGTKIHIRYQKKNPELAFIDSFYHIWFAPLMLVGFALALFFFAWYPKSCLNHPNSDTCRWDSAVEL